MPSRFSLPTIWKWLLAGKLILLAALWLYLDRGFDFGDVLALAKDQAKDTEAPAVADKSDADGKPAATKEGEGKDKGDVKDGDGEHQTTRKSFLSNLLELPELDPKTIQKEELGHYLEIAERKKRQVEERLQTLKKREEQLKGLEHSIDEKLHNLDDERKYFVQTIQKEKDLKGERLDKLITLYAKMEPKKAAPVLEKLDKDLVVDLFKQLPQKQITAILEAMSPDKSVQISEYFGRVRSTREYDVLKEMNQSLQKEFSDCKGMPKTS